MPDLDNRLARSRSALLDEIEQPPMADVRRRASRIRRRRAATAGAAALALLGVIAIGARPWQQDTAPTVTATDPPAIAPVYRGGGIEIVGLAPESVHDLDGEIADVEFTDPAHGIAVAGCDRNCAPPATTEDGGRSWHQVPMAPVSTGPADVTAFPGGHWLLTGDGAQFSSPSGVGWTASTPPAPTTRDLIGPGELPAVDRAGGPLVVRSWNHGTLGPLATQPDLSVRWVAPAVAADGAWWVGGVSGTAPAVAVSRDAGRHWKTTTLSAPMGDVRTVAIGTLGTEVYAVATGDGGALLGIYHSVDGGRGFAPTYLASTGAPTTSERVPQTVAGDPVPLLDGRLLLVQRWGAPSSWWVSEDAGANFVPVTGLPAAGEIRRTYAGYVAYDLFESAWAAFSTDGSNWQKLQLS